MIDHNRWRDWQLQGFVGVEKDAVLAQEKIMLDFVTRYQNITWKWNGNNTNFKNICQQYCRISDNNAQGVIVFGERLRYKTTKSLVDTLRTIIEPYQYAYVAINRYELIKHDLEFELPDSIEETIDKIMTYCDAGFVRLHKFDYVDGDHMIAAHPMDCYGLCK